MNKFFYLTLATLSLLSPLLASQAEAREIGKMFCRDNYRMSISKAQIKPLGKGYELSFTADTIEYLVKLDKNLKSQGKKERSQGESGDRDYVLVHPMFEQNARNSVNKNGDFRVHVFLNGMGLCTARGKLTFVSNVKQKLFK